MAGQVGQVNAVLLKKDLDTVTSVAINTTVGGRLKKYTDARIIDGESRVVYISGSGNFTSQAPNLYGGTEIAGGFSGKTKSVEIVPTYKYAWEKMTIDQMNGLPLDAQGNFRIKGKDGLVQTMLDSLDLAEDITIIEALEETALLPENIIGDALLPISDQKNITLLKRALFYTASKYNGIATKENIKAVLLMDSIDWATVMVENEGSAVFMSQDYKHITGIDGRNITSVFGVAIETFNAFDEPKGDNNRTHAVMPGTAWITLQNNVAFASFKDTSGTDVKHDLFNGHTTMFGAYKSMGAKVKEAQGVWKFQFKTQDLSLLTLSAPTVQSKTGGK